MPRFVLGFSNSLSRIQNGKWERVEEAEDVWEVVRKVLAYKDMYMYVDIWEFPREGGSRNKIIRLK